MLTPGGLHPLSGGSRLEHEHGGEPSVSNSGSSPSWRKGVSGISAWSWYRLRRSLAFIMSSSGIHCLLANPSI